MAGYTTRQSTYTDGDVIDAADSNDEFDAILAAFGAASGHAHDGSAGEGSRITVVGTASDNVTFGTALTPDANGTIDIGTSGAQFKDLYIDGVGYIDGLQLTSGATVSTILDEDTMSSDSATALATQQSIKAYVDSQVTAQDLDLTSDSGTIAIDLDSETLTVAGGTGIDTSASTNTLTVAIDSTVATLTGSQTLTNKTLTAPVIGTISNTGTLTLPTSTDTLVGRATTDTLTNKTLTSPVISTISNTGTLTLPTSTDTLVGKATTDTLTNKTINLGSNTVTGTTAQFNAALSDGDFATKAGTETLTNKTVDLTSNTLTGTTAQFNTALSDGDFATLAGTETLTNKTVNLASNTLTGTTAQFNTALSDGSFATLAGAETLTNKTVNLTSNTLTGTTAQFNTALSDGDFATLAGTETLTNKTLTSPTVTSPALNTSVSGTAVLDDDTFATASATTLATSESIKAYVDSLTGGTATLAGLTDTNITTPADGAVLFYDTATSKWIDNVVSGDITIADTGVATLASSVTITTPDIDGGTIDGTTIGGSTPASGTFTTGQFNNGLTIDGGNTLRLNASSTTDFFTIIQGGTQAVLTADSDGAANMLFKTASAGVDTDRMQILSNGDIAFYDSTGVSQDFLWDASASSINVNGTITSDVLTVSSSSSDMIELNHSTPSNVNYIGQDSSGNFRIKSDTDDLVVVASDGSVGIGTTSPASASANARNLVIDDASGNAGLTIRTQAASGYSSVYFGDSASYTTGRIEYRHGDDAMVFSTNGGTERMRVDSSGRVTMPNQPSFAVEYRGAAVAAGNDIVFNTVLHNTGSHYNTGTGVFTAPVAGKYLFNAALLTDSTTAAGLKYCTLRVNGSIYVYAYSYVNATSQYHPAIISQVVDLSASDAVKVRADAGAWYGTPGVNAVIFSGQLLS